MSLKNIEKEVESLFSLLPVAAVIQNIQDGKIIEANHQAESLFGLKHDEIIGLTPIDLSPEYQPDGQRSEDGVKEKLSTVLQSGAETFFWLHKHRSGEQLPCLIQLSKLPFLGKEFYIGFVTKIHRQREVLRGLLNFRHIFEHIDNPIAVVDTDYVYREVNPAYCKLFKKSYEDIVGQSVPEILGKDIFKTIAQKKYDRCFSGEKVRFQTWYKISENVRRFFDIQYFPHYDSNQEIDAVISCVRDITEISELQDSLSQSEIRFKAFMDNIPANVYIKDENDIHVYFNKQCERTMGQNADELLGKRTHDFFEAAAADHLVNLDKKILATDRHSVTEEWLYEDGRKSRYFRDYKFPISLQTGVKLLGGIAFDVTDIKQNERKLQKALKEIESLKSAVERENISLREKLKEFKDQSEIVGESDALQSCLRDAEHVAAENTTVLILGETGTGKELLAKAIHNMSSRQDRPMVKVNCAALPGNLIESELFGREKGAFTGAMAQQPGRFEIANGSSIFLDEIGDLPLELQSKLLRVLQEGKFERLGSTKTIRVDVRVIAATNRNLTNAIEEGTFRKDLFYRLNVFPITLPPLSKRREDIPLLIWKFVERFNKSMGKSVERIPDAELERLKHADWPGNIRELKNMIERSMIISRGSELTVRHEGTQSEHSTDTSDTIAALSDVERNHILKTLQSTHWRVSGEMGAAKILNIKPTTLEARMKKLGIVRPPK